MPSAGIIPPKEQDGQGEGSITGIKEFRECWSRNNRSLDPQTHSRIITVKKKIYIVINLIFTKKFIYIYII